MKEKHEMEGEEEEEASRKRKRKRKPKSSSRILHDSNTIFPLLLASLSNSQNTPHTSLSLLVNTRISQIRPSLLSQKIHLTPILALLPTLLTSQCAEIARRAADIVGAASLASFEMNREIAADCETVKGLIALLGSSKRRVLLSACNAILDLSTTTFGQQQLLKFSALEKLIFLNFQHLFLYGLSAMKVSTISRYRLKNMKFQWQF